MAIAMSHDADIGRILELRQQLITPVAKAQRVDLPADATLRTPPLVLMLGNHSSGKSSLINHLLDRKVQRTGVAPTDDGFTILLHGEEDRSFDGSALISNPNLPFGDLGHFGPGLTRHLQGHALSAQLLRHVRLIDSPGMIDAAGADVERPYDFPAVVRWFAEQSDLILLFFDPEKPGTTGETLSVLNESLTGLDHKLRIVMNKMDLFDGIRDFARTYGAVCWNLSRTLQTKDLPHIYTTVIPELVREECALPLEGFAAALLELEAYIGELPQRRVDSVLSRVMEEGRLLFLRASVTEALRKRVNYAWWKALAACLIPAIGAGLISWYYFDAEQSINALIAGIVAVALLALCGWLPGTIAGWRERRGGRELDQLFTYCFRDEMASRDRDDDLTHDRSRARRPLQRLLATVGLKGLRHVSKRRLRQLRHLIDEELPTMRRL